MAAAISLENVTKRFFEKTAVDHVSFQVAEGECFGLIGPNGAGKTTSFSMMCGFLFPTEGKLTVMGADPSRPGALKKKVGVLPQDAVLPASWTVGSLLTYWARLSECAQPEAEARSALERVSLPETWGVLAGGLSHGMAKRVALAQALLGAPPVLLLDEPTAGLDPKIAAQVRELIRSMKGQHTIVVSSHNLQELEELCDAAAILDKGKLAQAGSMVELTSRGEEFRVQIARGTVPLDAVRALSGCTGAQLNGDVLAVSFESGIPAEEMITRTLQLLLSQQVYVLGVSRGRRLEERVLQLT